MKECTLCGQAKGKTKFSKGQWKKSGGSKCKVCIAAPPVPAAPAVAVPAIEIASIYSPPPDYASIAEYSCDAENKKLDEGLRHQTAGKHGNWSWLPVSASQHSATPFFSSFFSFSEPPPLPFFVNQNREGHDLSKEPHVIGIGTIYALCRLLLFLMRHCSFFFVEGRGAVVVSSS